MDFEAILTLKTPGDDLADQGLFRPWSMKQRQHDKEPAADSAVFFSKSDTFKSFSVNDPMENYFSLAERKNDNFFTGHDDSFTEQSITPTKHNVAPLRDPEAGDAVPAGGAKHARLVVRGAVVPVHGASASAAGGRDVAPVVETRAVCPSREQQERPAPAKERVAVSDAAIRQIPAEKRRGSQERAVDQVGQELQFSQPERGHLQRDYRLLQRRLERRARPVDGQKTCQGQKRVCVGSRQKRRVAGVAAAADGDDLRRGDEHAVFQGPGRAGRRGELCEHENDDSAPAPGRFGPLVEAQDDEPVAQERKPGACGRDPAGHRRARVREKGVRGHQHAAQGQGTAGGAGDAGQVWPHGAERDRDADPGGGERAQHGRDAEAGQLCAGVAEGRPVEPDPERQPADFQGKERTQLHHGGGHRASRALADAGVYSVHRVSRTR
ncbi:hypothetical protein KL929_003509 [Ogataea haglerorum]|nr:hypothetical protein KL929_003509 [Ogataea haglerorum]